MAQNLLTVDQAQAILDGLATYDAPARILSAYSGRGMYGKTCVGFTFDDAHDALAALPRAIVEALATTEDGDDFEDLSPGWDMWSDVSSDNMGKGVVYYFPHWEVDGTIGEDDEDGE